LFNTPSKENLCVDASGSPFWLNTSASFVKNNDGKLEPFTRCEKINTPYPEGAKLTGVDHDGGTPTGGGGGDGGGGGGSAAYCWTLQTLASAIKVVEPGTETLNSAP
jgi:hypothetical protein